MSLHPFFLPHLQQFILTSNHWAALHRFSDITYQQISLLSIIIWISVVSTRIIRIRSNLRNNERTSSTGEILTWIHLVERDSNLFALSSLSIEHLEHKDITSTHQHHNTTKKSWLVNSSSPRFSSQPLWPTPPFHARPIYPKH